MKADSRRALITGITGQDGSLLANYLIKNGLKVSGTFRRGSGDNFWRLNEMQILDEIELHEHSIGDNSTDLLKIVEQKFDYIYHLAGDSFTQDSFRHPYQTINTNLTGSLEILDSTLRYSKDSKVFIACSSEIYGNSAKTGTLINENHERNPLNPYGISQTTILDIARYFRNVQGLFVSVGILFNHESEYRSAQFLTRKLSLGLAEIKVGKRKSIKLGNLNSARDWGSAEEYVGGFKVILDADRPDDFILATGKSVTVRELIIYACKSLGFRPEFTGSGNSEKCVDLLTGNVLIEVSPEYFRKVETPCLTGSTEKIQSELGWKPTQKIEDIIAKMCSHDVARIEKH
jgi:GDPmannose 4,6-dehydratase